MAAALAGPRRADPDEVELPSRVTRDTATPDVTKHVVCQHNNESSVVLPGPQRVSSPARVSRTITRHGACARHRPAVTAMNSLARVEGRRLVVSRLVNSVTVTYRQHAGTRRQCLADVPVSVAARRSALDGYCRGPAHVYVEEHADVGEGGNT